MPADVNLVLQSATTITATATATAVDLKTGTPTRGLLVRLVASSFAGTSPTASFKIQESTDNTTYIDKAILSDPTTNVNSITAAGQMFGLIKTRKRYIRLISTISGTNPVLVFKCEFTEADQ